MTNPDRAGNVMSIHMVKTDQADENPGKIQRLQIETWVTFWQDRKKTVKAYAIPRETEKAHSTWRTMSAKWLVGMIQQYTLTTGQILRWKALEDLNIF